MYNRNRELVSGMHIMEQLGLGLQVDGFVV